MLGAELSTPLPEKRVFTALSAPDIREKESAPRTGVSGTEQPQSRDGEENDDDFGRKHAATGAAEEQADAATAPAKEISQGLPKILKRRKERDDTPPMHPGGQVLLIGWYGTFLTAGYFQADALCAL